VPAVSQMNTLSLTNVNKCGDKDTGQETSVPASFA